MVLPNAKTSVGRPKGEGKPTKNAEAVRRCREKQKKEIQKLDEENAALKAQNRTLILKAQQQSAKIEQLERQIADLQPPTVDPRNSDLATFHLQNERIYNRRNFNNDYPHPISLQNEQYCPYPTPQQGQW